MAVAITIGIQAYVFREYVIPSGSMERTLNGCSGCTNDRALVDKLSYDFSAPRPGDVVVFRGPPNWSDNEIHTVAPSGLVGRAARRAAAWVGLVPPEGHDFVKRVIATAGQTVWCCDARNRVVVNGRALDEPYIYWQPGLGTTQDPFGPVTVPPGRLWVMGDNRNNSDDSRTQGGGGVRGVVPVENVIGKVRAVIWPPARWRGVGDHNPQLVTVSAPSGQTGPPGSVAVIWPALCLARRVREPIERGLTRRGRR